MSQFIYPKNTCLWAVQGSRCTSRESTSTWEKHAVCKICENIFTIFFGNGCTVGLHVLFILSGPSGKITIWSSQERNRKERNFQRKKFYVLKGKLKEFFPLKDNSIICRITHITIHFCLFFHHQSKDIGFFCLIGQFSRSYDKAVAINDAKYDHS